MNLFRSVVPLPAAAVLLLCATAAPVRAQDAGQSRTTIGSAQGSQTFQIKGHFTIWAAAGLDLDIVGDVTRASLGTINGTSVVVDATAYPDVYVKTQHRRYIGIGYGLWGKNEVIARYQTATNPASTIQIGHYGTETNVFPVSFDNYQDRLLEFGLRHYAGTPKRTRQYMQLLAGMKNVEPIAMHMFTPSGTVDTLLYGKSRVPTIGLEFGITAEFNHVGLFLESGARWQKRLTRDDSQLQAYGLEDVNSTGARFFMPATVGVLVRF